MPEIISKKQIEYLESFRKKEDKIILEIEKFAKENKVPILNRFAADFMEQLIRIKKPKRVLELGTAIAYSSIRIGISLPPNGILDTIELGKESVKIANKNINKAKLNNKINVIYGNAIDILPKINFKYDFIFLDVDKEDYSILFDKFLKLLRKEGIIFVDNLLWHGYTAAEKVPKRYKNSTTHIREFNKKFMNHSELQTSIVPIGDGIGLGLKI